MLKFNLPPNKNGYAKIFKVKDGSKDKDNKLMSFRINDEKLLKKYKAISETYSDEL